MSSLSSEGWLQLPAPHHSVLATIPSPHASALATIFLLSTRYYRFLAPKDKAPARRAIRTIRTGVKILARQPQAGRPVEEMDPEFREWQIDFGSSSYIAMYRFDGESETILAVRHQKEDGYY